MREACSICGLYSRSGFDHEECFESATVTADAVERENNE
jgi:hypothetical protein